MQADHINRAEKPISILEAALRNLGEGNRDSAKEQLVQIAQLQIVENERQQPSIDLQAQIFNRDRYICRYCGRHTICPAALRYISGQSFKDDEGLDLFPWHPHWKWSQTHPLYYDICASCDHLVPVTRVRQRPNDVENLMTSCYKCNSMKANWLIDELPGWTLRPKPDPDVTWDGLTGLFVRAMKVSRIDNKELRDWVQSIEQLSYQSRFSF